LRRKAGLFLWKGVVMEKKEQDRFPEMPFPGMSKVLDVLPHPGEMFLEFFKLYNRIYLRPVKIQEYASTQIMLHAFRGDKRIFPYGHEDDAVFTLDREDRGFFIIANHNGLEWERIKEKRRTFLFNKVRTHLEECRFYLQISERDAERLADPEKFVSFFWGPSSFQNARVPDQLYIDVNIFGVQNGPVEDMYGIKGLDFFIPKQLRWESLIPYDTVHYKIIEIVAFWHENWRNIEHVVKKRVEVDLRETWQKCQRDIRTELKKLNNLIADERILQR
jgi:hypothetical protein